MQNRLILVVLIASAAVAGGWTAFASGAARNPVRLALQRNDVPSTVQGTLLGPPAPHVIKADILRFIGTGLRGADYSYTWPAGGRINVPTLGATDKQWHLSGDVYVASSVAAAKTLFANGRAAQHGFFSDFGTDAATRLVLPRYGDEQFGLLGKDAGGPQAMVFVRKGTVVWELRIGHSPPQWIVTRTQVLGQLKIYAAKEKARVG